VSQKSTILGIFINNTTLNNPMKSLTAIVRKGEKQFVALCPEVDVVSQGPTVEEAVKNLKEAVELFIEEMGLPEEVPSGNMIVVNFEVEQGGKAPTIVG
jgi:predicted RNase H-like HicB family nuclease